MRKLASLLGILSICATVLVSCAGKTDEISGGEASSENGASTSVQTEAVKKKKTAKKREDMTVLYDSKIGEEDGYNYELWKDSGDTVMTITGDGCFECEWKNINNALFRIGKKFDCTKTYEEIGNIELDFAADYEPDGNSYLCLYGWTREPLVEYYIVESWGSWRPPGGEPIGTIEVDDGEYDVYRTMRVNQPSIDGNTTFEQYWSVRREKRTEGSVNATAHFMLWESLGMKMGKLYEAAFTVEGYQSSGHAVILENSLEIGGELPEIDLPEPPAPQEPDENGFYFISDFEADQNGWGSRGGASVSRTDVDGGKALFVSGRNQSWQGAEHPLDVYTFIPGDSFAFSVRAMQNSAESAEFKMTLQYNTSAGTSYDGIAQATAQKGEWVTLENPSYKIPEGAWGLVLYVETTEGTVDFYIDDASAAVEGE